MLQQDSRSTCLLVPCCFLVWCWCKRKQRVVLLSASSPWGPGPGSSSIIFIEAPNFAS